MADQKPREVIIGFADRLLAFYSEQGAWKWLSTSHSAFDFDSAITLVCEGRADEVDAEIHRLETGAYV